MPHNPYPQTEKWIEVETTDSGSKIYMKVAFSITKSALENKTKTPAKYNNYIESSKSYEASPRVNHLTTKNSSVSTQPLLTLPDEVDLDPLSSVRKRSSTNTIIPTIALKPPPTGVKSFFIIIFLY